MTTLKNWKSQGTWLSHMTEQAAWGLIDHIQALGPSIQGIEIGVNQGINSAMLLDACPNIAKIYGVDPFESYLDWRGMVAQSTMDEAYGILQNNLDVLGPKFELIKMKSSEAAAKFQDQAYDFVFIDGDHGLNAVISDLTLYSPKIRKGGLVAGHDIGIHSVNTAIRAWCRNKNIDPNDILIAENQAWYWVKV